MHSVTAPPTSTPSSIATLQRKSIHYRKALLRAIKHANAGHTGGGLSALDILNVLYNRVLRVSPHTFSDPNRDRYIQSKGHAAEALYVVLADCGFFPEAELETMNRYQSHWIGHPTRKVPGVEQNTGALGHGLSLAVGTALAAKRSGQDYRVFTLMGDGELAEGSVWEASMTAAHYQLDNLIAIVDRNTLQISGRTEKVNALEPLAEKFRAFGYAVAEVDGHNIEQLVQVLEGAPLRTGAPTLVLAHTVKGKGISFMEDAPHWHHKVPSDAEYAAALAELDATTALWEAAHGSW